MVNYHDPVVVLLDSCAWSVILAHGKLRLLFFAGALVKLCHAVDSLYLSVFPPAFILPVTHFDISLPAGSFSTVLNTNGASSAVTAPTAGQSGSVIPFYSLTPEFKD